MFYLTHSTHFIYGYMVSVPFRQDTTALVTLAGKRNSSMVRAFTHGVIGHRIDPSWGGPIEIFLVPLLV